LNHPEPFPHAVSSISSGVINTTFSYDPNGNMVSGNGLAITYTAFNKPETITRGANTIGFAHDTEHQRFKQIAATGETLYLNAGGLMSIIRARSSSENRPPLFGLRAAADRLGRDDAVDRLSVRGRRDDRHEVGI
jgi:hypothetical protein